MKRLVLLLFVVVLAGCFRFGDNIELSGVQFTSEHLKRITELTGVRFPSGSHGLEYVYFGDGLDPWLAAKIEIPKEKKEEFLANDVFRIGRDEHPHYASGKDKKWWRVSGLTSRVDRTQELPNVRYLECSFGEEDGRLILYLSWVTT